MSDRLDDIRAAQHYIDQIERLLAKMKAELDNTNAADTVIDEIRANARDAIWELKKWTSKDWVVRHPGISE